MVTKDFWVLLAMVLYFIAMLSIGFAYSKRSNSSAKQYFAGGRGVGPWLTALSAEASDMSGWLLMGLPGLAYFTGAADAMWTAIGLAIGTYLNWRLVARRLRRYSVVAGDAITVPDFFSKRFHDKKNVISTIAALIILIFFCVYVGSCFVTVGKLFSTLFGWDYHLTMVVGAAVVFAYTLIGGYLSVVVTDFIQGMLMFFALAVVFIGSIVSVGGVDNTVTFLRGIPGFLDGTHLATPVLNSMGEQIVRDGKAVRLRQGESGSETDYGSPLEAARTWVESGAQWIHLVDLDAAFGTGNNRDQLSAIVKELGEKVNIEMSGGVRDDDSLKAALDAGAARVNIGTAALENPDWTASVIKKYGDRVAVGLDVRGHTLAARGWVKEGGDLFETMKFLDSVGCSRYVVTDVARDGMMSGPNLTLLREVAERTDAHVTASGGISSLDDLRAIKELAPLGVDAAILGKSLYARAFTLEEALEVAR